MQAAHYAAQIPLLMGYVLHRIESIIHTGIVKGIYVETADYDDPEHPVGNRPQIIERIQCGSENAIKCALQTQKYALANAM
jgi:hypothetical protein